MIVGVTGGRDYADEAHVFETLDAFHKSWPITLLVHGAAKGADTLAAYWADTRKITHTRDKYRAHWADLAAPGARIMRGKFGEYNANAGKARNQRMVDEAGIEVLIAFPGERGTADMIMRAEHARVPIIRAT